MPRRNEIILSDGERLQVIPSPDTAPRRPRWWNRRITLPLWVVVAMLVVPLVITAQFSVPQSVIDVGLDASFFSGATAVPRTVPVTISPRSTPISPPDAFAAATVVFPPRTGQPEPTQPPRRAPVTMTPAFVYRLPVTRVFPQPHVFTTDLLDTFDRMRAINTPAYSPCEQQNLDLMSLVLASTDPETQSASLYLQMLDNRLDHICRLDVPPDARLPRWSPDGERILFSAVENERRNLYIASESQAIRAIQRGSYNEMFGDWDPVGNGVWYAVGNTMYYHSGFTWNDALYPWSLSKNAPIRDLALSPDASQVAFVSSRDNPAMSGTSGQELYLASTTNGNRRRLTDNDVPDSAPAWSPDGRWLAWVSGESAQLWLHDTTTDEQFRYVYSGSHAISSPIWLPTNDGITFIVQAQYTRLIVVQMFNGEVRVITGQFPNVTSFDWR